MSNLYVFGNDTLKFDSDEDAIKYAEETGAKEFKPVPSTNSINDINIKARQVGYSGLNDSEKAVIDNQYGSSKAAQSLSLDQVHKIMDSQAQVGNPVSSESIAASQVYNGEPTSEKLVFPNYNAANTVQDAMGNAPGTSAGAKVVDLVKDVGSFPGRTVSGLGAAAKSVTSDIVNNLLGRSDFDWYDVLQKAVGNQYESMANPEGSNFVSSMIKDPVTGLSVALPGAGGLIAKGLTKVAPIAEKLIPVAEKVSQVAFKPADFLTSLTEDYPKIQGAGRFVSNLGKNAAIGLGLSSAEHGMNTSTSFSPEQTDFSPFTENSTLPLAITLGLGSGIGAIGDRLSNNAIRDFPGASNQNYKSGFLGSVNKDLRNKVNEFSGEYNILGTPRAAIQTAINAKKGEIGRRYNKAAEAASKGSEQVAPQPYPGEWRASHDAATKYTNRLGNELNKDVSDPRYDLYNNNISNLNNKYSGTLERPSQQEYSELVPDLIQSIINKINAGTKLTEEEEKALSPLAYRLSTIEAMVKDRLNNPDSRDAWTNLGAYSNMSRLDRELQTKLQGVKNVKALTSKQDVHFGQNVKDIDPVLNAREITRARTALIDPSLYDPKIGAKADKQKAQLVSGALHDVLNELLLSDPRYARKLGRGTPAEYAKLKQFSQIVDHPGSIGMANRLPFIPFSVDPWRAKTAEYGLGNLVRGLASGPVGNYAVRQVGLHEKNGAKTDTSKTNKKKK